MNVKIEVKETSVSVSAPYVPQFPARAKAIGGKWSAGGKVWKFDSRDEVRVRELCREIYGTDGLTTEKLVTVRVNATGELGGSEYFKFGRQIARRPSRDTAVRLGDGVIIITGSFSPSGGSAKYPSIMGHSSDEVIFEIRDVPESMALVEIESNPETVSLVEGIETRTLSPFAPFDDAALIAELERRGYKVSK